MFFFNVLALSEAITSIQPATAVFKYTICLYSVDTYMSTKWGLFFLPATGREALEVLGQ